jgi:hypothetical protein
LATVPVVEQSVDRSKDEAALVAIDLDDLREDMRDPAWQDFLHRASAYRQRLRELGNLH